MNIAGKLTFLEVYFIGKRCFFIVFLQENAPIVKRGPPRKADGPGPLKLIRIGAIFKFSAYSPRRSLAAVHLREILFFTLSFFASHQVVIFDGAVGLLNKGVQFAESPADVQAI